MRTPALTLLIGLSLASACGGGGGNTGGNSTTTTGGSTATGTTTSSATESGTTTGCGALVPCDGVCVQAASCAFSVTAVAPAFGPINGGNFVTLHGHGFAKGMRVDLADGRAVVRVLDEATALVQPPPGPHQTVDVKVTLAGASAVLPGGYQYRSATLGSTWEKKQMATPRGAYPGLALLQDGRMLIVGGAGDASLVGLTSADLYDPAKDAVAPALGAMSVGRVEPAVVTLMNGKVLVVSAWSHPTAVAELFDPATDTFAKSASSLVTARTAAIATLLVDGRVLVMSHETPSAEIYDPDADTFTAVAGAPAIGDFYDQPWPVRLRDGRVLVVKGSGRQSYFFDPDTEAFTPTGNGPAMVVFAGSPHEGALQLAPDGRVFAVGGIVDPIYTPTSTIAVFDPESPDAGFTPFAAPLTHAREAAGVTLLNDGEILSLGGNTDPSPQARNCQMTFAVNATVDVIDPAGTVSAFPALPEPNWTLSAATLLDGSLIAVGGMTCGGAVAYPYLYFLQGTPVN